MVAVDAACGFLAGIVALLIRFQGATQPLPYVVVTAGLPVVWVAWVAMFGGYDARFIGLGSEEFRRVINAAISLTAAVAIVSYALKVEFARGYVLVALPCLGIADTAARFLMRKWLHHSRNHGRYMRQVTAVGHAAAVSALVEQLRRDRFHGLEVTNVCLADYAGQVELVGIPVAGGLADAARVAAESGADTVAVLACPEMDGLALRRLAWELEKDGTDLCVAPALMDVAGPRTTIRPVAGLPLLHVDHAELSGVKRAIKTFFDAAIASTALFLLSPLFVFIAIAITLDDHGPVLFSQTRIGKDGLPFMVLKFRTMVTDAELRKQEILALDDGDGLLFKVRRDPRITSTGSWLRRWSLDELPQLFNVILGEMSLVGPRPPLPSEAARYGDDVRRRLVVKPGMTGLWQVNGRSDLSREDATRLDLRYVENWSFVLDLQILWKTCSAVTRGRGAYLSGYDQARRLGSAAEHDMTGGARRSHQRHGHERWPCGPGEQKAPPESAPGLTARPQSAEHIVLWGAAGQTAAWGGRL